MRWLVFSHIFIALCAVSLTIETVIVSEMGVLRNVPYLIVVFCATLVVYNLKGIRQIQSHSIIVDGEKGQWLSEHNLALKWIFFSAAVFGLIALFFITEVIIYSLIPLGLLSIGYSFPLSFGKGSVSFREMPFMKVVLVAFVWTIVVALLPFINAEIDISLNWGVIISDFMFLLALAILFDIKDVIQDAERGLKTIPLYIGINGTKLLSISIVLIRVFLLKIIDSQYLYLEIFISLFTIFIIVKFINKNTTNYFYMIWIDGIMIIKGFLCCYDKMDILSYD